MTYDEIISKVAESTGLSKTLVNKTYKAYWKAVRDHIISIDLKGHLTDEEFEKARPNINIPSIGKLHVSLDRYHRFIRQGEIIKEIKERKYGTAHKEN